MSLVPKLLQQKVLLSVTFVFSGCEASFHTTSREWSRVMDYVKPSEIVRDLPSF